MMGREKKEGDEIFEDGKGEIEEWRGRKKRNAREGRWKGNEERGKTERCGRESGQSNQTF